MTVAVEPFKLPITEAGEYPDEGRVRLRGDRTGVYQLAKAGAEGWVRDQRYDPVGKYRMVFIEWDVSHWSYNDQAHMWAFEEHFEPVNEDSDMDDETKELLRRLLEKEDQKEEKSPEELSLDVISDADDQAEIDADEFVAANDQQFIETLRSALGAAKRSDSFLLIAVTRDTHPQSGNEVLIPQVYKSDKSEDAGVLLGAQVTQLGQLFHQQLAGEKLRRLDG